MTARISSTARAARWFPPLVIAAAALSILTMAPAHAAGAIVYQGDDYASLSVGGFSGQTFDIVDVCDREADGHGVYVKVVLYDGYDQLGDANGSASPCSSRSYARRQVDSMQVCEAVTGPDYCSRRAGLGQTTFTHWARRRRPQPGMESGRASSSC